MNENGRAIDLLERVVAGGFFCYPMMAADPWLAPLRRKAAFVKLLGRAEAAHQEAAAAFAARNGERILSAVAPLA